MRRRFAISVAAIVLAWGVTASAHTPALVTPGTVWTSWSVEPWLLAALLLTAGMYGRGVGRLWTRAGVGRGVSVARVVAFAGGLASIIVALVSPLDTLGGTLLSAHMAQHGVLAGIAPPLLMLGEPRIAFAWAIGGRSAVRLGPLWRVAGELERPLSSLLVATLLLGGATWIWHAPALFDAAVRADAVHVAQHVSFFLPAVWFWSLIASARSPRRVAAAAAAAFATFMHTGLLGALITMAPQPLYGAYVNRATEWGLTPLADQQLAGILMWVPLGLPYVAAGLWLGSRLLAGDAGDLPAAAPRAPVGPF